MTDPRIPQLVAEWNRQREALLAFDPDIIEDQAALLDTLDGNTDALDFVAFWCRAALADEAMAIGLRTIIADNQMRLQRLLARAEKKRGVAMSLMDAIGEKKITRPDITITVNAGRHKVFVSDETELPDAYVRIKREPNKVAILEALENGEEVPGANLSNRTSTLTIRTK
jgi:hypothetical protein